MSLQAHAALDARVEPPITAPSPGRTRRGRRIPVMAQSTATDCAATCLRMVLAFHGRHVPAGELSALLAPGRDGASAWALLEAARSQGLVGRGLRLSAAALHRLRPGSILHWDRKHFVVLERVEPGRGGRPSIVTVVDPGVGRCRFDEAGLRARFSGLALELWPGEGLQRRQPPRSPYGRYLAILLAQPRLLSLSIALSLLLLVWSLAVPLLTALVVDGLMVPSAGLGIGTMLVGGLLVVLAHAATTVGRSLALVRLHERFDRVLVPGLVDRLLALPASFFQQRSLGDLMMRVSSTSQLRDALTQGAVSTVMDGLLVVTYLALLAWLDVHLALVAVLLAAAYLGQLWLSHRGHRELTAAQLHHEARARGSLTRMLAGIETLKATGSEPEAAQQFHRQFEQVLEATRARGRFNAYFDGVAASLRLLGPLALLVLGAHAVTSGRLGLGAMLGATQLALAFLTPLSALVQTAVRLQTTVSHVERVEEIHATPTEDLRCGAHRADLAGAIELSDVSVRYGAGAPWALRDVSLTIEPGQRVAIVGASGSGKSTLARVLLGLCPPQQGQVCVGGVPSDRLDLRDLRRRIGVVTQEACLFDMTIAQNLALAAPDATREELEHAARLARIHDDIEALPMGYDTRLTDGGSTLSGGQRQRLALARALVRRPELLLLDEATSALDTVTERAIHDALRRLGATVVTIAHRLDTVRDADVIVVMDRGQAVDRGTHHELLVRDGVYRRLVDATHHGREARAVD
ncbi:peptidase domain-containing ABC transporter [Paraliomyxa miuraensis]|uniref:peptidase domain-containing ABC transporter n=1 Tax=Paraliomyxa miuraensis TaxID=376150 RepID=UPI002256C4B7|nr:peptidase domain-containing ABC transporter [Paraliomyxa miuraensis]MCX4247475.1 peptidase domain-containing ABC transporter [Paraliomyxa miuraensis]